MWPRPILADDWLGWSCSGVSSRPLSNMVAILGGGALLAPLCEDAEREECFKITDERETWFRV